MNDEEPLDDWHPCVYLLMIVVVRLFAVPLTLVEWVRGLRGQRR